MQVHKSAVISEDGLYRYELCRYWEPEKPKMGFIMLNPSTADADVDDPTIRRCMGFARGLGYGGIEVYNLFAFRATSPDDMKKAKDPIGPDNNEWLKQVSGCEIIVAAWGTHGGFNNRDRQVVLMVTKELDRNLYVLKLTKDKKPCHPLYLKADLKPIVYRAADDTPQQTE